MSYEWSYIASKIRETEVRTEPFRHLYIENFFSEKHLELLTTNEQIRIAPQDSAERLIQALVATGWTVRPFPGCTESVEHYLECLNSNYWPVDKKRLEGFGLAFRLAEPRDPKIAALLAYLNSPFFKAALQEKFAITRPHKIDNAIHKYLTGYEISPHPDIRSKCLTYLININTSEETEREDVHTHLLSFKEEYKGIYDFWRCNRNSDTDWVPWEWCETKKRINRNNSLVMFAPSYDTLHAVKLRYNHLRWQRTQIYGNLWFTDVPFMLPQVRYDQLILAAARKVTEQEQIENPAKTIHD